MVGREDFPRILRRLLHVYYHEAAHQKGRVRLLLVLQACVVIYFVLLVLLIAHELFQFLAEEVHLPQVQRPEVREERLVHQVVVDAKVKCV